MSRSRPIGVLAVAAALLTATIAVAQAPRSLPFHRPKPAAGPVATVPYADPATTPAGVTAPPSVLPAGSPQPVMPASSEGGAGPVMVDLTPHDLPGGHGPLAAEGGHGEGHAEGHGEHEKPDGGWLLQADFLIWRARQDALDYALVDPTNDLVPQGRMSSVAPGTNAGFRAGIGYRLPADKWDAGVTYTYFRTDGQSAVTAPTGGVVYPQLTRVGVVDLANSASANASVLYHAFDLDVGRTYVVDDHFTLRMVGGVRLAMIENDLQARYDGQQAVGSRVLNNSKFEGAGQTVGGEARWTCCNGLHLFGGARGGLLYGDFTGTLTETNGNGGATLAAVQDEYSGLAPFVAIGLGGGWKWKNVAIQGGYEVTHYFNVATRPTLTDDFAEGRVLRRRGDLSLDGIFLRASLNY